MKKLLVTTAAVLLTVGAFAQGTVNLVNASTVNGLPAASRNVTFSPTAAAFNPLLVAGANVSSNYAGVNLTALRVGLLYAPSTVSDLSAFSLATFAVSPTFKVSTSATAGSWYGQVATLTGITKGQTANMVAVVWDSSLAASPLSADALKGLYGQSSIFQYTVPGGDTPAASEYFSANLRAFSIGMVPEPTSFALLGLGAAAMLIFRRRS